MFKSTATIIKNQGERIINLEAENEILKTNKDYANRKCLDLQGKLDDSIEERMNDLKTVASHLTRNDYGNPRAKIAIALEFIEGKIKELDNDDDID